MIDVAAVMVLVVVAEILNRRNFRYGHVDGQDRGGVDLSLLSSSCLTGAISGVYSDCPIGKNSKDSNRIGRAFLHCECGSVSSVSTNH